MWIENIVWGSIKYKRLFLKRFWNATAIFLQKKYCFIAYLFIFLSQYRFITILLAKIASLTSVLSKVWKVEKKKDIEPKKNYLFISRFRDICKAKLMWGCWKKKRVYPMQIRLIVFFHNMHLNLMYIHSQLGCVLEGKDISIKRICCRVWSS